jgi:EpsI family protein
MRPLRLQALIAALVMLLAAAVAYAITPRNFLAQARPPFTLASLVPESFGDWSIDRMAGASIITADQSAQLNAVYNDILSRTYVNSSGVRIMLAVTYGRDQRADGATHYPEVCYPAQGFRLLKSHLDTLTFGGQRQPVKRLETSLNDQRKEPVTYWTTIGDYHTLDGLEKRLIELRYGVKGMVPDGVLFRVSSIGSDSVREFDLHTQFIDALLESLPPSGRLFLTGRKP